MFVDIYSATFNINPENIDKAAIERARAKGLKPKAIISVDLFGLSSRYRLLEKIAEKENLSNRGCCARFWWFNSFKKRLAHLEMLGFKLVFLSKTFRMLWRW